MPNKPWTHPLSCLQQGMSGPLRPPVHLLSFSSIIASTLVVLLLAASGTVGGCNVVTYPVEAVLSAFKPSKTVEAEFNGLPDRSVAIVIRTRPSIEYEYRYVCLQMSLLIEAELKKHVSGVRVVDPRRVAKYQSENIHWNSARPAELGKVFGADFVLYVSLAEHSTREAGYTSLLRGSILAEAGLHDVSLADQEACVWRNPDISVAYPTGGGPVQQRPGVEDQIRYGTQRRFAEALVKKFRRYKVKDQQ